MKLPPIRVLVPTVGLSAFAILFVITAVMALMGRIPDHGGAKSYWILIICFALAWYNVSTVWLAQRVTYPLFNLVGKDHFVVYHASYDERILPTVISPVILLMIFSAVLIWFHPATLPVWMIWTGAVLEIINAVSTGALQVPAHNRLSHGFSWDVHARLVSTNWIRTTCFTVHGLLMIWMVEKVTLPGMGCQSL